MTNLELTKACAEAMGITVHEEFYRKDTLEIHHANGSSSIYDPLHDDAQAMALVKKLRFHICPAAQAWSVWPKGDDPDSLLNVDDPDLNRAIVKCVAKLKERP